MSFNVRSAYDYSYKISPSARRTARKQIGLKRKAGKDNGEKRTDPPLKKFKLPVYYPVGGGEPVVATGAKPPAKPPVFCSKCGTKHHLDYCPRPCTICYSRAHFDAECPFLIRYQKDADFNRDRYHIVCGCGHPFNEEKWACASCPRSRPRTLLKPKYCDICYEWGQHLSHECTKDKEKAALFKALNDHDLLYGWNSEHQPQLG